MPLNGTVRRGRMQPVSVRGTRGGSMRRFSLSGLIGVIALLAMGLAALRNPSPLLAGVVLQATYLTLVIASLAAVLRRGGGMWAGFAVFAWAYFLPLQGAVMPGVAASHPAMPLLRMAVIATTPAPATPPNHTATRD